jgi:hypothetical protein
MTPEQFIEAVRNEFDFKIGNEVRLKDLLVTIQVRNKVFKALDRHEFHAALVVILDDHDKGVS